jgi:glycosyltransferase involved in cell wall biosynthesis
LPYLEANNVETVVVPFFSDAYVNSIGNKNSKPIFSIALSYIFRFFHLIKHRSIDLIWVEYEVFPWLPYFIDKIFFKKGVAIVVDYDDAIFHRYDLNKNSIIRKILGRKIASIMKISNVVIVGNQYLKKYALLSGSKEILSLPTVIDLKRYIPQAQINYEIFKIGWIGSPTTSKYLNFILPVIEKLNQDGNLCLILIGAGQFDINGVSYYIRQWSESTEVDNISEFDVGIMPLPDNPWERGKSGYKLIQYMACGKPVVASPVGANTEIVEHGVNGFLAESKEEWLRALTMLRDNPGLRKKMGRAGREKVKKKYCLQITAPTLVSVLKKLHREMN